MAPRTSFLSHRLLLPLGLIGGLFLVYALLPTQNSTSDAYYYAGSARWETELWQPHHLLYNVTGFGFVWIAKALGVALEPLPLLQFLNACGAAGCLWVLWRILIRLQPTGNVPAALLLVAGSSFATLRYATENETYLLPLFFSLLGSLFWTRFYQNGPKTDLSWSGFWAALACLFHQIHFFWWLGLLVSCLFWANNKKTTFLRFAGPALVVPLGYALVMYLQGIPFSETHTFVLHDFFYGQAKTDITFRNFLMTGISLVRSFVEVHGRIPVLVQHNPFYIIPALVTGAIALFLLRELARNRKMGSVSHSPFFKTHASILALQVLFAWFAVGNAEFMVMVPKVAVLLLGCFRFRDSRRLFLLGTGLLVWNLAFAVFPNHRYGFSNHACVFRYAQQHPGSVLLLQDKNAFDSFTFYQTGRYTTHAYETESAPQLLRQVIAEAHQKGHSLVTDFYPTQQVMSRRWLLHPNNSPSFFAEYRLTPVAACPTFFGPGPLSEMTVSPKAAP